MRDSVYEIESDLENSHWWFKGRRLLFSFLIKRLSCPPASTTILDLGTGTGANLRLFKDLGYRDVVGLDSSDLAIQFCAQKGLGDVKKGDICNLPFTQEQFKLVLAADIIEHVSNDKLALKEIYRVTQKNGFAIVTAPAFQCLWGIQDEVGQHKRRYQRKELLALIKSTDFEVIEFFYFNYLLFPPIWLMRQIVRFFNIQMESENQLNSKVLNEVLSLIFNFDVISSVYCKPPFGVSMCCIAQKRNK